MPSSDTYTLGSVVVEKLFPFSTRQKDYFVWIFRELAASPYQRGEVIPQPSVAREIKVAAQCQRNI